MFGILADMAIQLIHSLLVVFVKLEGLNHHREVKLKQCPVNNSKDEIVFLHNAYGKPYLCKTTYVFFSGQYALNWIILKTIQTNQKNHIDSSLKFKFKNIFHTIPSSIFIPAAFVKHY